MFDTVILPRVSSWPARVTVRTCEEEDADKRGQMRLETNSSAFVLFVRVRISGVVTRCQREPLQASPLKPVGPNLTKKLAILHPSSPVY